MDNLDSQEQSLYDTLEGNAAAAEGSSAPNIYDSIPSYLVAADNHAVASGGLDFATAIKAGAGTGAGAAIGQALIPIPVVGAVVGAVVGGLTAATDGKFAEATVVNAANSFYNTGVAISNWFGADAEAADMTEWMDKVDGNLGEYYQENKGLIDASGFIAGSLVPGTLALKGYRAVSPTVRTLKAAEKGFMGPNMAEATGLFAPLQQRTLNAAITEITASNTTFSLLNRNLVTSLAAGFGEQAMQAAVMETAIAATMFQSPVLEGKDVGDLASHMLWGTLFGGALGGVIEGAVGLGSVYKGLKTAASELMPYTNITAPRPQSTLDEKVLIALDDKFTIPTNRADDVAKYGDNVVEQRINSKISTLHNDIRTILRESSGDDVIGNMMADEVIAMRSTQEAGDKLLGVRAITRMADRSSLDKEIDVIAKKIAAGTATPEELVKFQSHENTYLQLVGEHAGEIYHDAPIYSGIQDTLKKGESIKIGTNYIQVGSRNRIKVQHGPKNTWDIMKAPQEEIEAMYLWAYNSPKLDLNKPIPSTHVPFLEKAYLETEGLTNVAVKIKKADGSVATINSRDKLLQYIYATKDELAIKYKNAALNKEVVTDIALAEKKVKEITGVHFTLKAENNGAYAWTYRGDSNARRDIFLNSNYMKGRTIADLVFSIKHEEGHNAWNLANDIGMVSASDHATVLAEAAKASKQVRPSMWKGDKLLGYDAHDYEHEVMADMFAFASLHTKAEVEKAAPKFAEILFAHVNPIPPEVVDALNIKARNLTNAEIAKRLNMRVSYLDGAAREADKTRDYLANQSFVDDYYARMAHTGLSAPANRYELLLKPQHAKISYDTSIYSGINAHTSDAITAIKQRQVLYKQDVDRILAANMGQDFNQLFDIPEEAIYKANPLGTGSGVLSPVDGSYGTVASFMGRLGNVTNNLVVAASNAVSTRLTPSLFKIRTSLEDTMELSTLLNKVRGTNEKYELDDLGENLILAGAKKAAQEGKDYRKLDPDAEDIIPIKSANVIEFVKEHIAANGARIIKYKNIRGVQGLSHDFNQNLFYAPPVNPRDFPHHAFVVPKHLSNQGEKTTMIHAASEKELEALSIKVPAGYKVVYKGDTEEYFKARGDFDEDLALYDTSIDSTLHKKGTSAKFFPDTDGIKLTDDLMKWHIDKEAQLVREHVMLKYFKEFAELRNLGDTYTKIATSKYGRFSMLKTAEEVVKNPYIDYIKTALNISNSSNARAWTDTNTLLDRKVSEVYNTITGAFVKTKSPEELDVVNTALQNAGVKTAYYDAATDLLANHTAPKHILSTFVQRANAILASVTLRPDILNAVNNTVGMAVLTAPELRALLKAIEEGSIEGAGALAQLAKIKVIGTDKAMLSFEKLVSTAVRNFGNRGLVETARRDGYITRHLAEYQSIADDLALTGVESVSDLNGLLRNTYNKAMKYADVAEKYSGNKTAEEFTRFVAADIMRQITDVGVKYGVLDRKLASSYIQTFVNRAQGNYLASQRPLLFQGPIGQAIGLFQTYQVTLLHQLFRHVAAGQAKNSAMLLGLQGTIYGLNGLPAFQAINTHLIGNASGNTEHKDIYGTVYSGFNKEAADWITYGAAANMFGLFSPELKTNIYTRGDINPRHVTLIPTNLADIPIVAASSKFFGNLFKTGETLLQGGDVSTTLLRGLEQNGVNRPLAGLAAALQAFGNDEYKSFSSDNAGNLSMTNDLFSLVNLTRIVGGKPLDEAITRDFSFRKTVYDAADAARKKQLGRVIKSQLVAQREIPTDVQDRFLEDYVKAGGEQQRFNKYIMGMYKQANVAQANLIADNLKSPYSKAMQSLLNGYDVADFTNTTSNLGE